MEFEEFKFIIPKSSEDLMDWGSEMHNCIGGYAYRVKQGNIKIIGVYKNSKLTYNISINGKNINQFYGFSNSEPPEEDKLKVLKFLKEKNIINESPKGKPLVDIFGEQDANNEQALVEF